MWPHSIDRTCSMLSTQPNKPNQKVLADDINNNNNLNIHSNVMLDIFFAQIDQFQMNTFRKSSHCQKFSMVNNEENRFKNIKRMSIWKYLVDYV